ncbi:MAG: NUDIX hydrolase [Chloroflexi bacterium]|nr:NUDIX hydrolase [Chloroflexota bacterium]MDA1145713.1 NUDIX hydrolase [Chloroflexota bacterium]
MTSTDSTPSDLPALVSSEVLVEGHIINVERDIIRFHDGHEAERMVVRHPGAIALVVVDDKDRWLLVRQYRHPAGDMLLEIPAGTREPGEPPADTAAREVREETGYAAASLIHLGGTWMAPGFCSEYIDFYLASDLSEAPLLQDDDEYIGAPVRMTEAQVEAAIGAGEIRDAKTLVALTLVRLRRGS